MASTPNTQLCLEELEEGRHKVQEPHEVWYRQVEGLAMGKYPWRVLEHGRKSDIKSSHKYGASETSRLPLPCGLVHQIASALRNRRMPNGTYGGVRGRKTKVGRKLLRFPPTRLID